MGVEIEKALHMERRARASLPLATLTLGGAIVAVYGAELADDGQALCAIYGLIPAKPSIATATTSLLVHCLIRPS